MPLKRTFDVTRGAIVTSIKDTYLDRLSKWSDIQEYLPLFYDEARNREKPLILELGSRRAYSTIAFLAGAAESGGHVWSCDILDVRKIPGGIGMWARSPSWTFIQGDDMNAEVQGKLPVEADVLFIDTSHEYEHTLAECRAYVPRVRPGGIALFHDTNVYDWPGYKWEGETTPVRQALNEYCAETGLSWEQVPGKYGLGVIRP